MISDPIDQWLYFFRQAGQSTAKELTARLPDPVFAEATGVLEMIGKNLDERTFYNKRLKVQQDARLRYSQTLDEDWRKGLQEGELLGGIKLLQSLLGDTPATSDELLDVGPAARGGDSYTVNNTGQADNQPTGASFRVIINTGNWDASVATNSPGQSGDPNGKHYRDLFAPWAEGRYFPLLYTRPRIEAVTRQHWELRP